MFDELSQTMIPDSVVVTPKQSDEQLRTLARIKRAIRRKTSGGVQKLVVQLDGETFVISGRCTSFYCKQVAQESAMHCLKATGSPVRNEIEVSPHPH